MFVGSVRVSNVSWKEGVVVIDLCELLTFILSQFLAGHF